MPAAILTPAQSEFIDAAAVARLATVYPDGSPHVVPICPVLDLDRIILASDTKSAKTRNIAGNPEVAVCFDHYDDDWDELKQVIVFGSAYLIESGFEWERDRDLLNAKFPQYPVSFPIEEGNSTMVEIRIERVSSSGF